MSQKQTTHKGWIILMPMGKDFSGKQVWHPFSNETLPRLFNTKHHATINKFRGDKVVRATITTEWEDVT